MADRAYTEAIKDDDEKFAALYGGFSNLKRGKPLSDDQKKAVAAYNKAVWGSEEGPAVSSESGSSDDGAFTLAMAGSAAIAASFLL